MKVLCFALLAVMASSLHSGAASGGDRTITKVVKLLQDMLEKSKEEGKTEKALYGKFKCYCDTNDAEKKTQIETLSKTIGLLESAIESLQAESGVLSAQAAKLKADMTANEEARESATNIRGKRKAAFEAEEQDLQTAVGQMDEAIKVLSEIGSDQTLESGADHKKFMSDYKGSGPLLLRLGSQVKTALAAASIFLSPQQKNQMNSFLQGPSFTGTYTAQSGQVVGILKDMRATFQTNLEEAQATEAKEVKAHEKFMETKLDAYNEMESTYNQKQETLGSNDESLSSKKEQLQAAEKSKADAEEFLTSLTSMCADKAKEFEERNLLRANEDAAIAEAISILNSDSAFETFGTVDATGVDGKTGLLAKQTQLKKVASFLQLGSSRSETLVRRELEQVLRAEKSTRLMRVLQSVEAGNPFEKVLLEIEKMKKLNEEESKEDKKNLDWCNAERTSNNEALASRETEITGLEGDINDLTNTIDDPTKGLKQQIKEDETTLIQNNEAQVTQTKSRTEENVAYQADVRNLVDAEDLLSKAIAVLTKYYAALEKKFAESSDLAMMQKHKEEPAPPETWDNYSGQKTKGNDAISMLNYILSETHKEETEAHTDEEKAQHDYEDGMTELKKTERETQKNLAKLREDLATAEKSLIEKKEDLKKTEAAKVTIENYLQKIKPGCDFITTNFEMRETNRATETAALTKAVTLIKKTPAYIAAKQTAKEESFGKCKEKCLANEAGAECKACMADVTVPAYCAGHPGTDGC